AELPMSNSKPTIVVAGDVCIDWLSIPIEPKPDGLDTPFNWEIRGGRHMYACRGGAWLTADWTELAAGDAALVRKSEARARLESISPSELIHSILMLAAFPRHRDGDEYKVWGVERSDGYAGPPGGIPTDAPGPSGNDHDAQIVVLDDAGN